MKNKKDTLRGFFLGVLLTALVASIPMVSATVAKRSIDVVYNDIKLVIDGKEVTPLDGSGKVVEPFIYNGTTYLPLRAVANALTGGTKPVDWDQATHTVYIGERPVTSEPVETVDMAAMKTYPQGLTLFTTDESIQVRQQTYTPFNMLGSFKSANGGGGNGVYLLNGDYTTLNGLVAVPDHVVNPQGLLQFKNEDTQEVLLTIDVKRGDAPIEVSLDVTGLDKLRIIASNACFFNATLTPIPVG